MTAQWNDPLDEWNEKAWGRPVSGIYFAQWLPPDGQRRPMWIDRPAEIVTLARQIVEAGGSFHIEKLRTGEVSMTVERDNDDEIDVLAAEICKNGPDVPAAVDRLVQTAHRELRAKVTS